MRFLGISTPGPGSAVALLDDSSVLFAIEEEKLSRLHDPLGLPRLALDRCLFENHLKISDCRAIAVAERSPVATNTRKRSKRAPVSASYEQLAHLLRSGPRPARFDHHLCHASSAYYTSGFDRALILSLDEGHRSQSGLIALGDNDEIASLHSLKFPDSLGWFFSRVTELAGFRPHSGEHKLQWLSKDGEPEFLPAFRKLLNWKSNGLFSLNRRYFVSGPDHLGHFSPHFYRELGFAARTFSPGPVVRANLARSAQDFLQETVLQLAASFAESTGARSLCLAGGLFLNILLVRALETSGAFEQVYVQPVSGNEGTALGAAFLSRKKITGSSGRAPLSTLALGMLSEPQEMKAVLDNCK